MKLFIKIFIIGIVLFIAESLFAGVNQVLVERVEANESTALHYKVTAWGILDNGAPKVFDLSSEASIKKCKAFENCELFGLNREAIRCVIIFDGDTVRNVAFHMEERFEVNTWAGEQLDEQATLTLSRLKTFLESQ